MVQDGRPCGPSPRALLILLGVFAVLLAAAGYGFYRQQEQNVRNARYNELKAIAELKVNQIVAWRRTQLADARLHAGGIIRRDVLEWLSRPEDAQLKGEVRARLQEYRELRGYENIILASPDCRILLSLSPHLTILEPDAAQLVTQAVDKRRAVLGDFYRCPPFDQVHLDLSAPILGHDNRPEAVLIFRIDPAHYLYPLIHSWPMPSRSAETLLTRRDGDDALFLTPLRHRGDPPLTLRIPLSREDLPTSLAVLGKTGAFEGRDYRSVGVLAEIRPVEGSEWFMIAKVDSDEILSEARYRATVIGFGTLALVLLAALGVGFVYKHRGKRTYQALYRAERERREAQEAARARGRRFQAILSQLMIGVLVANEESRIEFVNQAFCDQLGLPDAPEALIGIASEEMMHKILPSYADPESTLARIREALARGQPIVGEEALLRDGRVLLVDFVPISIDDRKDGRLWQHHDITARKRAEEALRESEERFFKAFHSSPDAIMITRVSDGRIEEVNQGFSLLTGYSREEALASSTVDIGLWADPRDRERWVAALLEHKGGRDLEFTFRTRAGKVLECLYSGTLIDLGGEPYVLSVVRDITERKQAAEEKHRLETQLRQAQKMEAVGRLAGGVAHDFNNMLGVISGHTEIAMMKSEPGGSVHHHLEQVLKAAQRSVDLVRQLLAFARKQTVSPKVLNLNDTVTGMLKMLQRLIGEDIDLVWKPGHELWQLKIDPSQVDQLLANLAVNARDAIAGVGVVTIETNNVVVNETHSVDLSEEVPGEYVLLAVSDSGCGMTRETLANIFEPFFTTKGVGEGTGLGLSTVYGIVKQNDGFIKVYSEPGQGSIFKIYLPRFAEEPVERAGETGAKPVQGGSETVLLVEDERAILDLGRTMLEKLGYTVMAVPTAGEAIRLVTQHKGPIDLVITDVVMPEMNGRELVEKLTDLRPEIRCLYMSGYTADIIAHRGVLDDGINFIQKPFFLRDLAEKVREVLERN